MKKTKAKRRLLSWILAGLMAIQMVPAVTILNTRAEAQIVWQKVPTELDTSVRADAYSCSYQDQWVPMFPTGTPDNATTWPEWSADSFAEIVQIGYKDVGALHMKSQAGKNTAVTINAGMRRGQSYTLGLWARGTAQSQTLFSYGNGDFPIVETAEALSESWQYYEVTFTAIMSQLNLGCRDWGSNDIYVDNITLKDQFGKNLLSGLGDFCREVDVSGQIRPMVIDPSLMTGAHTCLYENKWVAMFPTGKPDNTSTWPEWNTAYNYAEIVAEGYKDIGALHMKSCSGKNTGIAIQANMEPGCSYTLGLWAKGISNSGRVLGLYGNGDQTIVSTDDQLKSDWTYYELTITAQMGQLNLVATDWGDTEIWIDNITLKNSSGIDILSGLGDFWEIPVETAINANWDFEDGLARWQHNGILADSTMTVYTNNVYSGKQAMRVHRQNGQMDMTFVTSQELIPVAPGDRIEIVAHTASRNSVSGSFSMYINTYDVNVTLLAGSTGQERITNTGSQWSAWDTYEMTYIVDADVNYIRVGMRIGGTCADVLIDDLIYYNYTENGNTVFSEDFSNPSVTTGLPGGWCYDSTDGQADFSDAMTLTGDGSYYTDIFSLTTGGVYTLTANAQLSGEATGQLLLQAVDHQGNVAKQTEIFLESGTVISPFTAASAVYYRLRVVKNGSGTMMLDDIRIQKTGENKGQIQEPEAVKLPAVDAVTTTSSVEAVNGRPTLFVNGEPQVPLWYARPENPDLFEAHTVTKFAETGIDTVVSYVFLNNYYGNVWTPNGFVPQAVDDMMLSTLAGNPNAKLMVALDFNAPQWWLEQNPGELVALSHSTPEKNGASFASQKWKEDSGAIMVQAINHMMKQSYANNIIGFKITGGYTLEWNWWGTSGVYNDVGDFSECGVQAFRAWLTEKYGTDAALQQAYGDSTVTLAGAIPPSAEQRRDDTLDSVITIQTHPQMVDYEMFMAGLKADTIEYFAKLVKDAVNDRLVVGTYGGYFYMGGGYEFTSSVSNVYFQKLLQSKYIDFIKSPWMYGLREIGDSTEFMGPVDSLDLYGKLWIVEEDSRLNLREMPENQDDKAAVGWTRNYQQSVEQLKRNFSYVLSKGMGMSFYNLAWGFTDDAQYYGIIGQMYDEMAQTLFREAKSTADIAVFVDGESNMLVPYEEEVFNSVLYVSVYREQLKELGHIGVPYDMYLLDDLKDGLVPEHKINIFLGTTLISEDERTAIETQLKKNSNILVWVFTSGISDGTATEIAKLEELTDMDMDIISTQRKFVGTAEITSNVHWLTDGMQTGRCYGVESYDKLSPVIAVTDSQADVLACYVTGDGVSANQAALSVKDMGDWVSIYSAVPNLPQGLIRNMLSYADCHSYTDSGSDVIYASSDHVALHSVFAGTRTVRVPVGYSVYDVFRGQQVSVENGVFSVTLTGKETRLFRLTEEPANIAWLDNSKKTDAYTAVEKQWVPMYPTGIPDDPGQPTWLSWGDDHYAKIVEEGGQDLGSLYMKSCSYKNTAVAIQTGMVPGHTYTLGLWAKGSSNSGRVLALYANGDPTIISTYDRLKPDWSYYEITFTANTRQLNLVASDWGNTEIWIDNITLKNSSGIDILSGHGDFWRSKDAMDTRPAMESASLTLGGILNLNIKAQNTEDCILRATVGGDVQTVTAADGVYTVMLPVHRLYETVTLELCKHGTVVDSQSWTMEGYADELRVQYGQDVGLMSLLKALENYGVYAACYANPTDTAPNIGEVEAVTHEELQNYALEILTADKSGLQVMASLYLDDACDLQVKFRSDAGEDNMLYIDNQAVAVTAVDDQVVYRIEELLPQDWSKPYSITVKNEEGTVIFQCNYSVLSYAYTALGRSQEAQTGLNGLLKAMYRYSVAAVAYGT